MDVCMEVWAATHLHTAKVSGGAPSSMYKWKASMDLKDYHGSGIDALAVGGGFGLMVC